MLLSSASDGDMHPGQLTETLFKGHPQRSWRHFFAPGAGAGGCSSIRPSWLILGPSDKQPANGSIKAVQ